MGKAYATGHRAARVGNDYDNPFSRGDCDFKSYGKGYLDGLISTGQAKKRTRLYRKFLMLDEASDFLS